VIAVLGAGAVISIASPVAAHPLGNFTTNQHLGIEVVGDELRLEYVVDMAEIPAFTEIRKMADRGGLDDLAADSCPRLMAGLSVTLDEEPLDVAGMGAAASTPPGDAGVPTLRIECRFASSVGPGTLRVENHNYPERLGWREITVTSSGTAISTDLPATSPSGVLTSYPDDETPLDVRTAIVEVGSGVVVAGGATIETVERLASVIRFDGFGPTAALAALAAAVTLGAGHALAPGHGKTIVAAYLVGTRGTMSQALLLAGTTAVSHTLGVAVLGVVVATAASSFDPARLYPYLSALAGVVVLAIGARLLWMALRRGRRDRHEHDHDHHHDHPHPTTRPLGWRAVAALGLSGGLVPSASAVVLLLGAVHVGRAWFGVLLIAGFGIGMAVALVGSGLLAVAAHRLGWKVFQRRPESGRVLRWVPGTAAVIVLALGAVMTIAAVGSIPAVG
jgi:ABC-type nickel/cobalt efflux system permease component RcnA